MLVKIAKTSDVKSSEITPQHVYLNRRRFIQASAAAAGIALLPTFPGTARARELMKFPDLKAWPGDSDERKTSFDAVTHYNNFYEFGTGKTDPSENAGEFQPKPWSVEVTGHAAKTGTFAYEDIVKPHALEERIYRLRCVEAWSMVIPWVGFPLADLIKRFEPTSQAKYVAFETLKDENRFTHQKFPILPWPYVEGLRMDEAMNPLTLVAVGVYGQELPSQNGAPIRIVVPWKYGYKSIKSLVKISFVGEQPPTTWNIQAPNEYGFYSNVNPEVSHPRWSQAMERRITGEGGFAALLTPRIETRKFNGYEEEVAGLYAGMDLAKFH